ncbi:unnamed protein product [Rhizophagus irregularis]|nr:unnamed protein product [Rhizophagus irregularis]
MVGIDKWMKTIGQLPRRRIFARRNGRPIIQYGKLYFQRQEKDCEENVLQIELPEINPKNRLKVPVTIHNIFQAERIGNNSFVKEYQVESDSNTIESDKDTDISDEEEDSIAIFSRKTHVQEVHYATVPIEYPKTSEYGVATVYNITGWKNPRDCWKNVEVVKAQLRTVHSLVILALKKKKETAF